jgi:hypothetical protein
MKAYGGTVVQLHSILTNILGEKLGSGPCHFNPQYPHNNRQGGPLAQFVQFGDEMYL